MNLLLEVVQAFGQLIFPKLCIACHAKEPLKENIFCLTCKLSLPYTDQVDIVENELELKLMGRIPLQRGAALFRFTKDSKVKEIIHQLKYQNRPQIGIEMGRVLGRRIKKAKNFERPDLIVPVPLHYRKQAKRGYNQSYEFGKGLSEILDIPLYKNVVKRKLKTDSQTKKGRIDRLNNMLDSFELTKPKLIQGKHVLLVDDVITTGATLEGTALKLLQSKDVRLSLGLIAMAES